jgi:ribosome-binding factor A
MAKYLERFQGVLLRELNQVLRREYGNTAVRITFIGAEVGSDLKQAKVFYSVIGQAEEVAQAKQQLKKWSRALRHGVAETGYLKVVPHLAFVYHDALAQGARVTQILDNL